MTYTNNPKKLLKSMHNKLKDSGFLIFTHRVDLIIKQNFIKILEDVSNHWKVYYKSRPILYLPNNKDYAANLDYYVNQVFGQICVKKLYLSRKI